MLTGNPQTDYPRWRSLVFTAIRGNVGSEAGKPIDDDGQYENVDFAISMSYRVGGGLGDAVIQKTIIQGMHRNRRMWLTYEWYAHSADPTKVGLEAVYAYKKLLGGEGPMLT